jgi:hypothetical protein
VSHGNQQTKGTQCGTAAAKIATHFLYPALYTGVPLGDNLLICN